MCEFIDSVGWLAEHLTCSDHSQKFTFLGTKPNNLQ